MVCKISAIKIQSALCKFFKFFIFFTLFLAWLLIFNTPSPKCFKKISKLRFRFTISCSIEFHRQNRPENRKRGKIEKTNLFSKSSSRKITIPKLTETLGKNRKLYVLSNGKHSRMTIEGWKIATDTFLRFPGRIPPYSAFSLAWGTRFWARIWIPHQIL